VSTRGPARGTVEALTPYADIELCFDAARSQVPLARSVAAEVAKREGAGCGYVEKVRLVVGTLVSALVLVADERSKVSCLFRVLESEIRVRMSVPRSPAPAPTARSEHARMLDQLVTPASTFTTEDERGGLTVVSDAWIPVDDGDA
jgi:serine/threonine-protein kinase RsbW